MLIPTTRTNFPVVLIRSRCLTGFPALVARHGGDCDALLGAAGIARKALDIPDTAVPLARVITLLNGAAARLGAPDFGLQLSQYQDIDVLGAVGLIAMHSETVGGALNAIARNISYHSPGLRLDLEPHPERAGMTELRLAINSGADLPQRHAIEMSLGMAVRFLGQVTGETGAEWDLLLRHASPLGPAQYRQYFSGTVHLEQRQDCLVFPTRLLAIGIAPHASAQQMAAERHVGNIIRRFPLDLTQQVETLVDRQLAGGASSLVQVARQLGLHERTLQRRLKEQGVNFEDIVDNLRRSRAEEYLGYSAIPLAEVAAMLGYTEQSSFIRGCKRWFNTTPQAYRARRSSGIANELYSGLITA